MRFELTENSVRCVHEHSTAVPLAVSPMLVQPDAGPLTHTLGVAVVFRYEHRNVEATSALLLLPLVDNEHSCWDAKAAPCVDSGSEKVMGWTNELVLSDWPLLAVKVMSMMLLCNEEESGTQRAKDASTAITCTVRVVLEPLAASKLELPALASNAATLAAENVTATPVAAPVSDTPLEASALLLLPSTLPDPNAEGCTCSRAASLQGQQFP